jgi:hypothetical protein
LCDSNDEIYVMNADGSRQTRLTNNSSFDVEPSWGGRLDSDGDDIGDAATTSLPKLVRVKTER